MPQVADPGQWDRKGIWLSAPSSSKTPKLPTTAVAAKSCQPINALAAEPSSKPAMENLLPGMHSKIPAEARATATDDASAAVAEAAQEPPAPVVQAGPGSIAGLSDTASADQVRAVMLAQAGLSSGADANPLAKSGTFNAPLTGKHQLQLCI